MTKQELEKAAKNKEVVSVTRNGVRTKGVIRLVCTRLFILDSYPSYLPSVYEIEKVEVTKDE